MKQIISALLLCLTPFVVVAAPLKVVNVSAPAINCVFNAPCTISVNDTSDNIVMSTGGTGLLQSRTFKGAPGSPADGLFGYEYRVNLKDAVGAVAISCIDSMTISFGSLVSTLNYGGSSATDQVFVITSGGIGTIGLASAVETGSSIKFTFASPICEGGAPGKGESSFFWGLASKTPPKFVTATLYETGGATHHLKARAAE